MGAMKGEVHPQESQQAEGEAFAYYAAVFFTLLTLYYLLEQFIRWTVSKILPTTYARLMAARKDIIFFGFLVGEFLVSSTKATMMN